MSPARAAIPIALEAGLRRVLASALEWPGWCRSGRDEGRALEVLAESAMRYAPVAEEAGETFPGEVSFEVVERLAGNATTDFGAPAIAAAADRRPLSAAGAERLAGLVEASWRVFDRMAAAAPSSLRKGPRGGGRDRDAIVAHVAEAEAAYARRMGIRPGPAGPSDADSARQLRVAIAGALRAARAGLPLGERGWVPRYAARRVAWHALDHAWEIEDRSR